MPINWGVVNPNTPGVMANSFSEGQNENMRNALMAAQLGHATSANELQRYQLKKAMDDDRILSELTAKVKAAGGPDNLPAIADALIATGKPEHITAGIALNRKIKAQRALLDAGAGVGSGAAARNPMDPTGPNPSVMAGAPGTMPPAPTNALSAQLGSTMDRRIPALLGMEDPATTELAKMLFQQQTEANKPHAVAEGGALMSGSGKLLGVRPKIGEGMQPQGYGPTGELIGVQGMPGWNAAKAAQVAAEEAAKAGYRLREVPMGQGQPPQLMSEAQFLSGGKRITDPAERAAAAAVTEADQRGQPMSLTVNPRAVPGQGSTTAGTEQAKVVGKMFGETYETLQKGAMSANGKLNRLGRMEQLLDGVNTGKLTPTGTEVAAYADSLGFKVDKNLGNKQAAQVLANEMALEARNPSGGAGMPGAMSDPDREFLVQMTPNLSKSPEGLKMIIDTSRKMAQRDQQVAALARTYVEKNGQLDNNFYSELQNWSNANPLFTGMAVPKGRSAAGKIGGAQGGIKFLSWE